MAGREVIPWRPGYSKDMLTGEENQGKFVVVLPEGTKMIKGVNGVVTCFDKNGDKLGYVKLEFVPITEENA